MGNVAASTQKCGRARTRLSDLRDRCDIGSATAAVHVGVGDDERAAADTGKIVRRGAVPAVLPLDGDVSGKNGSGDETVAVGCHNQRIDPVPGPSFADGLQDSALGWSGLRGSAGTWERAAVDRVGSRWRARRANS